MMDNQPTSFISYTPEEIRSLGETIVEILDQDILDVLSEIKKNNRFIRRKSPVKLKYHLENSASTAWRKEKESGNQLSGIDLFNEQMNSNLNKISVSNFDIIQDNIIKILKENIGEEYQESCLNILFDKSVNESNFGILYSRLCEGIINIYGEGFRKTIKNRCDLFYNENIVKIFIKQDDISYDELCRINKEKSKLIGSFVFMGGLYINSIIEYDFIIKYFNILIDALSDDTNSEHYEKYIECLVNFISSIGETMEKELGENFNIIILDKINEIRNNRSRFKPRSRFLIMDLLDLHKNNWKKD
jgi:hypothetical protein